MSLRARVERLERLLRRDDFCPACMTVQFRFADEPDCRPPVCPRCGRGPGDYGGMVRALVIRLPPEHGIEELPALPDGPDPVGLRG